MSQGQNFKVEVCIAGPDTMMMIEPLGFLGFEGEIVDRKTDAQTFDTAHYDEFGLETIKCLSHNGATMGGKYFRPVLDDD